MKERIGDLKINGQSSSAGGNYNAVIINGEGRIAGDLDCIKLKINGRCDIDGNVKAESVEVYGSNSIKGNLEAERAKIHGTADIDGNLSVNKEAEIYGSIDVDGDCNAEIFNIKGTFAIEGLLNAGKLKFSLYGSSRAREIGGEKITVKKIGGLKGMIISGGRGKGLTADTIEGDDIYLENTRAKVVRGNNIEIGQGCEIELVEYNNSLNKDKKSDIGTHTKIG